MLRMGSFNMQNSQSPQSAYTVYFHVRNDFCQGCIIPLHATLFIYSVNISTYQYKEDCQCFCKDYVEGI